MELAIVLMIVGTLMSGVLVAVSRTTENNRVTNARAQLREIEDALYGFAQAYGRLPCPATDMSVPANVEDTTCSSVHGFIPSGTLGLDGPSNDDGLLVDPWQQPWRYSLIAGATHNPDFSSKPSIQTFFSAGTTISNPSPFTSMFRICDDSGCTATQSDIVLAVIMSLGSNWSSYTSANETLNAGSQTMRGYEIKNDYDFVSTIYSEESFDDQLIWISPYILFNRLVEAGKLP